MKTLRADLHIHTILSPCGDLEMSPFQIISRAREMNLDMIGITDHNSTRQCGLIRTLGAEAGILVLAGAEVTTHEEVHCLAFFPDDHHLDLFQQFLDLHIPDIQNDPARFGHQIVVNREEEIIYTEERMLSAALSCSIDELEQEVHRLNGLFIPAHIDRPRFSLTGQLGFIPRDLRMDAVEISPNTTRELILERYPEIKSTTVIRSSDAHYLHQIGTMITRLTVITTDFSGIQLAMKNKTCEL